MFIDYALRRSKLVLHVLTRVPVFSIAPKQTRRSERR